jgi:hypothetical protein
MTWPVFEDAAAERRIETRGQELDAAAPTGVEVR